MGEGGSGEMRPWDFFAANGVSVSLLRPSRVPLSRLGAEISPFSSSSSLGR